MGWKKPSKVRLLGRYFFLRTFVLLQVRTGSPPIALTLYYELKLRVVGTPIHALTSAPVSYIIQAIDFDPPKFAENIHQLFHRNYPLTVVTEHNPTGIRCRQNFTEGTRGTGSGAEIRTGLFPVPPDTCS